MKAIHLVIFFLILANKGIAQENTLEKVFAAEAIQIIKISSSIEQKALKRNNFNISPDVISFDVYGQLLSVDRKLSNSVNSKYVVLRRDSALMKFGGKLRFSYVKIFFSDVRDGEFFIEVIRMKSKNELRYDKRPDFGISEVFMFNVKDRKLNFVGSQKLSYM